MAVTRKPRGEAPEETEPTDTLISDESPEVEEISVALATQFVAFSYCSSSKVIQ